MPNDAGIDLCLWNTFQRQKIRSEIFAFHFSGIDQFIQGSWPLILMAVVFLLYPVEAAKKSEKTAANFCRA